MKADKKYCMNSFLQFRCVANKNIIFKEGLNNFFIEPQQTTKISNSADLDKFLCDYISKNVDEKTALMLSGGMDSAILAKYLPKGSKTFTLKCVASQPTTDESIRAKEVSNLLSLENEVIEITWEDYKDYSEILMKHKGAPIHSIEVQIYKAAIIAKKQGYTKLLFGESADSIYGGLNGLLSKDWEFDEFIERYNFVPTDKVLNNYQLITDPYIEFKTDNKIDAYGFISNFFFKESMNSYYNACETAGIKFLAPFSETYLGDKIDLDRIRNGESKYIIRELYKEKFPEIHANNKIPMPRATDLWLKNWLGPKRNEFKKDCIKELTGDQKFYIYILEIFLNLNEINQD